MRVMKVMKADESDERGLKLMKEVES